MGHPAWVSDKPESRLIGWLFGVIDYYDRNRLGPRIEFQAELILNGILKGCSRGLI